MNELAWAESKRVWNDGPAHGPGECRGHCPGCPLLLHLHLHLQNKNPSISPFQSKKEYTQSDIAVEAYWRKKGARGNHRKDKEQ